MITTKIFNIQKRVLSIILGISIFLSPCITYKICEYLYYIKHKGECSYNMFGVLDKYYEVAFHGHASFLCF